jgi:hypothetical protein
MARCFRSFRLLPLAFAHQLKHGIQEVVGSTPTGSTLPFAGPDRDLVSLNSTTDSDASDAGLDFSRLCAGSPENPGG